jgi:hypothetical protein
MFWFLKMPEHPAKEAVHSDGIAALDAGTSGPELV